VLERWSTQKKREIIILFLKKRVRPRAHARAPDLVELGDERELGGAALLQELPLVVVQLAQLVLRGR